MVTSLRICLLVLLTCLPMASRADLPPPPTSEDAAKAFVQDAAQDAMGQVWAIVTQPTNLGLCRWLSGQWERAGEPPGPGLFPVALARLPGGAVACVWSRTVVVDILQEHEEGHALTLHRGRFSRVLAQWRGMLTKPRIFGDTRGSIWLTGQGGQIVRVPPCPAGLSKAEMVETLTRSQFFPTNDSQTALYAHDPLLAVDDGSGRVWFWTDALAGAGNFVSLRGVLVWENGRLTAVPTLPGLPDKRLSAIAPHDPRHIWIAVDDEGLFSEDVLTRRAVPVLAPEPDAFIKVQKMWAAGEAFYVVSGFAWSANRLAPTGVLWRWRKADGWRKLIDGLDSQSEWREWLRRPAAQTADGLWLGSYGRGAWLVPANGRPSVCVDWRYGSPVARAERLFALPHSGVLAFGLDDHSSGLPNPPALHLEQEARRPPAASPTVMATALTLAQDRRGNLWNLVPPNVTGGGNNPVTDVGLATLDEWNGLQWTHHRLPAGVPAHALVSVNVDTQGRVWLVSSLNPTSWQTPTLLFDPATGQWQTYANARAALAAEAIHFPHLGLTASPGDTQNRVSLTAFSGDGRVAYQENGRVCAYDGGAWYDWTCEDILPATRAWWEGPPFYGKDGTLCVNIGHQINPHPEVHFSGDSKTVDETWAWKQGTGWHPAPYTPSNNDDRIRLDHARINIPPGLVKPDWFSLTQDAQGAFWLTSGNVLYKAWEGGLCAPVFAPGAPTPFLDGRRVAQALLDPQGNSFLRTQAGVHSEYVVVQAQCPLPQPSVSATLDADDTATLSFAVQNAPAAPVRFLWRVGDGPWSAPTTDRTARLPHLPSGAYTVSLAALDGHLQRSPALAVVSFAVHTDPAAQVARLIAQLSGTDDAAREAAVVVLSQRPLLARPALLAARAGANDDLRWWIDATLQQIDALPASNRPAPP